MAFSVPSRQALLTKALWTVAVLFFGLAVLGGIRAHTAVPIWDMWGGYLDFYVRQGDGHWSEWWSLHNEHRIVLARMLFWMDIAWFHGTVWFLIAVNYLLVLVAFFTFRALLLEQAADAAKTTGAELAALLVFACLFSWIQSENLTWGFQSQFFLAQLLPLLAFWFLYKAVKMQSVRHFGTACLFGVLSVGAMANGVLALPIMLAYAVLQRMGWKKAAVLALLALGCIALYFTDYHAPPQHGTMGRAIADHPVQLLQYFLTYLGSPFFYFAGRHSLAVPQLFGALLIVLCGIKALQRLKAPQEHPLDFCLLAFLLYVGGSALATAGGRSIFGIDQATNSRYTTPALMAWIAVMILYLPTLLKPLSLAQHRVVWPLLALLLLMSGPQLEARKSHRTALLEQEVGALAMELGVQDEKQIGRIFYDAPHAQQIASTPSAANLSIFGQDPIRDARLLIGRPGGPLPTSQCKAEIDDISTIKEDLHYKKIRGWIVSPEGSNDFQSVRLIDAQGVVVGYALMGENRPELAQAYGKAAKRRGFKGYVMADKAHAPMAIAAMEGACNAVATPPAEPPFEYIANAVDGTHVNVQTAQVTANSGWSGKDYYQSTWPGIKVLGSYVQGDGDTGSIQLRLQRGARLLYRSGPGNQWQKIEVRGTSTYTGRLPLSPEWSLLVFSSPALPDEFDVTLFDQGAGWGEWSAIAVREKIKEGGSE